MERWWFSRNLMRIENCYAWPQGPSMEGAVSFFRRKPSHDLVPIHPDDSSSKDWAILLEAGTIVGPSPRRIRVARYDAFLQTKYFIASLPAGGQQLLSRRRE